MVRIVFHGAYEVESLTLKADHFEVLNGVLLIYNHYDRIIAAFTEWVRVFEINS